MARLENLEAGKKPENQAMHADSLPSSSSTQPSMDGMMRMINDLQLQREKDRKDAEALRQDLEEAADRIEAVEKQAADRIEAVEKQAADRIEALENQVAAKAVETIILRETVDQTKASRQQDLKDAKALRQKDLKDAEEWRENILEQTRKELQKENERLKQEASDRALEQKQKDQSTQEYIQSLSEDAGGTEAFRVPGDEKALHQIKRRHLLDRAQALLAIQTGLSDNRSEASLRFRDYLSLGSSGQRQQRLESLIKGQLSPETAEFVLAKTGAIRLLAEQFSHVRQDGNKVAHSHFQHSWFEGAILRAGKEKASLEELLEIILHIE